jgi:hypothetical protein
LIHLPKHISSPLKKSCSLKGDVGSKTTCNL